jgi:RNA polymerase sigma-70 factor (sigma-E family)
MVSTQVSERTQVPRGRLAELYERHAPGGMRLAYLLTGDRASAEDLVHDAFLRVVGRLQHLRVPDAFDAYLRRAIVNLHTSNARHERVVRAHAEREGAHGEPASLMPDVGARTDMWRALLALPARQRAALVLRYYEDLSEAQTAETLRCSVAAVKSLVARGTGNLRGGGTLNETRGEER